MGKTKKTFRPYRERGGRQFTLAGFPNLGKKKKRKDKIEEVKAFISFLKDEFINGRTPEVSSWEEITRMFNSFTTIRELLEAFTYMLKIGKKKLIPKALCIDTVCKKNGDELVEAFAAKKERYLLELDENVECEEREPEFDAKDEDKTAETLTGNGEDELEVEVCPVQPVAASCSSDEEDEDKDVILYIELEDTDDTWAMENQMAEEVLKRSDEHKENSPCR